MKKFLFITAFILPLLSYSQQLHLTLSGGVSNYQGDLQGKPLTLDQSNGAFGVGLKYDLNDHFSVRSGFMFGRVEGTDKTNKTSLQPRNLSFQTNIVEGNFLLEYNFLDLSQHKFTPYVFGGLAVYHFNPYTYDTSGSKIFLQPLSTEGQGLAQYPDRKPYKLTGLSMPIGGGIKIRVSQNAVLGYEFGLRKLFTDYLDDVSRTYVDEAALLAARGGKAVEMAYRGGELKNGNAVYPADGELRGGAKQKDWYYLQGITLSIGLNFSNRDGEMGCPKVR